MNKKIKDLIQEVNDLITFAKGLEGDAKKVKTSCNHINNSWTGSDLIGHANLFFGNFEMPPNNMRFSIEWGLIRGIPRGWNEKTTEEVKQKIESDTSVPLNTFDKQADEIEERFDVIRKKTILLFSESSREASEEIEKFNLKTKVDFFNEYWKRQIMTRDSEAIHAGRQVPSHKYYGATASFVEDSVSQLKEFIFLIEKNSVHMDEAENKKEEETNRTFSYIDKKTLLKISKIENKDFDLSRLIALCKELDDNFSLENYYSCSMILRAILDHVPPIFGKKNFSEVSSQYGGKSFKDLMKPLEETARKIGDNYLHTQIAPKVLSISKTQVNFQANLDILLNEIANVLEIKP